jgi:hypothetical protein
MGTGILIGFAVAVIWIGSLYVKPFGRCGRCRGRGNLHRPGSRKAPVCPRCHGTRRQQRFGSRTVHRTVRMMRAERERARKLREGQP